MKTKNNNKKIMNYLNIQSKNLTMGIRTGFGYYSNPTRIVFSLSRYKFVTKMFEGFNNVLEVGAGDGFKSHIVKQFCNNLTLTDIEEDNKISFDKTNFNKKIKFKIHNFINSPTKEKFDGIYCLDVFEHINKSKEKKFISNIKNSLKTNGSLIIGMPSIESQKYASKGSKLGHVNCKNKTELKKFLKNYFHNVYMFSMNDEVLHTGFDQMSHYIIGLVSNKK